MHNEFTAVIEQDGDWYIAYCPEVPGANGQGRTQAEAKADLAEAIALMLEDAIPGPCECRREGGAVRERA